MTTKYRMIKCNSEDDWLLKRKIGGSSASAIIGVNPYKTNIQAYRLLTGLEEPEDISNKPQVIYGKKAEEHLRELFALQYVDKYEVIAPYTVEKDGFIAIYERIDKPYITATPDGFLIEKENKKRKGIWECKTTEVLSSYQKEQWRDRIPDNYYVQVLHYLMVFEECEFVELFVQFRYSNAQGERWTRTQTYHIERAEVQGDIDYLESQETQFWEYFVKPRKEPPLFVSLKDI